MDSSTTKLDFKFVMHINHDIVDIFVYQNSELLLSVVQLSENDYPMMVSLSQFLLLAGDILQQVIPAMTCRHRAAKILKLIEDLTQNCNLSVFCSNSLLYLELTQLLNSLECLAQSIFRDQNIYSISKYMVCPLIDSVRALTWLFLIYKDGFYKSSRISLSQIVSHFDI